MPNFLILTTMFSKLAYLIFFIYSVSSLSAQSLSSVLTVAEKSMFSKNYYDAFLKYKEALEFQPENNEFRYKAALAGMHFGSYKQAAELFELISTGEDKNKYPEATMHLGQLRHIQGDYEKAILAYKIYKTEFATDSSPNLLKINRDIKACEWALTQINNPNKGVNIVRMDNHINSVFSDFAPNFHRDTLIYSSLRFENVANSEIPKRHNASVLQSVKDGNAERMLSDSFPGLNMSVAHSSYAKDRSLVFYTICEDLNDYDKRCDLYISKVDATGKWLSPVKLPEPINLAQFSSTQPCFVSSSNENGGVLFFASNRTTNSKGGFDIWYTYLDPNGNFSEPLNCEQINTIEDEHAPFFYERSKTLYFSSRGHLGFGGLDFYSSRQNDIGFVNPVNIGYPQNSSFDDLYYYITEHDTLAYLASNRTGTLFLDDANEACCLDLFKLSILSCEIDLNALVYNFYTQEAINGATVVLIDIENQNLPPIVVQNLLSNEFKFKILCERNYKLLAHKDGYTSDSLVFYSGKTGEFKSLTKKLFLKPSKVELQLLTFNKNNNDPLDGVTLHIKDLDGNLDTSILNIQNHVFTIPALPCHRYKITASKPDFANADTLILIDCGSSGIIQKKLYLPTILFSLLPVSLFFDNDRPSPGSHDTTCHTGYAHTFRNYYAKKPKFAKVSNELHVFDGVQPSSEMDDFFEDEVKRGKEILDKFLLVLESDLKKGKKYEIFLKGYASPLAKSEYNLKLSHRRIHSVYNDIWNYKDGLFKKYIKSGYLKLSEKPFGESQAPRGISDQKKDLRSVFTVEASRERRVEIIEIKE
ncbi:MAG: PD40 domain-containing protein [Saprospiraceae bacterium]|nr:PD40 domain-containing protein [Saprospiraceae bacterium]